MFQARSIPATSRRGVILLVVVSLLTLFAIVGLSFVMYAESEAKGALIQREATVMSQSEVEPEMLLSYFMGQLIYDTRDNVTGVYSALRGHSLVRNMFGFDGSVNQNRNNIPFSGSGRWHTDGNSFLNPYGIDDYELLNYVYHSRDGFIRDPERLARTGNQADLLARPVGAYLGGLNVNYTYPDVNNMFLAAVTADGQVLQRSFHRPWTAVDPLNPNNQNAWRGFGPIGRSNPNWLSPDPSMKYRVLRPRPIDQLLPGENWPPNRPYFDLPEDEGGDVKNLVGTPGPNDSFWIDLGFPVQVTPEGRKFKALFAPLIIDLDNRVNVNAHGNVRGAERPPGGRVVPSHASNQGWGRWEVNVSKVLPAPGYEWRNLFTKNPGLPSPQGRYGPGNPSQPDLPNPVPPLFTPGSSHFYSRYDFDGVNETNNLLPSNPLALPSQGSFTCFPSYPVGYGNASAQELTGPLHPLWYNAHKPVGNDRKYGWSNMEALLRYADTNSPALTSELFRLCPDNFKNNPRARNLVTTHSYDYDRPGLSPWLFNVSRPAGNPGIPNRYELDTNALQPTGGPIQSPPLAWRTTPPQGFPGSAPPPSVSSYEYHPSDWRADRNMLASLGRLDLNRNLPAYPPVNDATGRVTDWDNPSAAIRDPIRAAFNAAQQARQALARNIFERLWRLTGAGDPTDAGLNPPPGNANHDIPRWNALRWLAQLAVNMVDYIDSDSIMTPFNWYASEWVFGTELPQVVLNEAYVDFRFAIPGNEASPRLVRAWIELHNTMRRDDTLVGNGDVRLQMEAIAQDNTAHAIYQTVIDKRRDTNPPLRRPNNALGDPGRAAMEPQHEVISNYGDQRIQRVIEPADTNMPFRGYSGPDGGNQGFYVLGPEEAFPVPGVTATSQVADLLWFEATLPDGEAPPPPTILLRRLACPYLQPQRNPALPYYNPYVTVDYLENVPVYDPRRPASENASWGKRQPYTAHLSQTVRQQPNPQPASRPFHTFFRHNADATTPGPNWPQVPANYPAFDWLVHLDRQIVSPMELLQVSAFKPHELTQQFIVDGNKFQQTANWFDQGLALNQSTRLHRVLEFLETQDRAAGMAGIYRATHVRYVYPIGGAPNTPRRIVPMEMTGLLDSGVPWRIEAGQVLLVGHPPNHETVVVTSTPDNTSFEAVFVRDLPPGTRPAPVIPPPNPDRSLPIYVTTKRDRVPGKININTIWDRETLQAMCDAQLPNSFTSAEVDQIFARLQASRSPNFPSVLGPTDRPFQSLATGFGQQNNPLARVDDIQRPFRGTGIDDTFLRRDPTAPPADPSRRLFQVGGPEMHPYLRDQLMTKIFNTATVRSNVFAVWLTVGFFEVIDDVSRPVKLGAEIGKSENRHVRHRMFSIIDRSWTTEATATTTNTVYYPYLRTVNGQVVPPNILPTNITGGQQTTINLQPPPSAWQNLHPGTVITVVDEVYDDVNQRWVDVAPPPARDTATVPQPPGWTPMSVTVTFGRGHIIDPMRRYRLVINWPNTTAPEFNNPGPQDRFNIRAEPGLIPYFSIIH